MRRLGIVVTFFCVVVPSLAHAQQVPPALIDAMLAEADELEATLQYVEEDARFLAQGALDLGDMSTHTKYLQFSTAAWSLKSCIHNFGFQLQGSYVNGAFLRQDFARCVSDKRGFDQKLGRLRPPLVHVPDYLLQATDDVQRDFGELQRLVAATSQPTPEPDVPGMHRCTATWSPGGVWMSFQGVGPSRNAAKAAALKTCEERVGGPYCSVGQCVRI